MTPAKPQPKKRNNSKLPTTVPVPDYVVRSQVVRCVSHLAPWCIFVVQLYRPQCPSSVLQAEAASGTARAAANVCSALANVIFSPPDQAKCENCSVVLVSADTER